VSAIECDSSGDDQSPFHNAPSSSDREMKSIRRTLGEDGGSSSLAGTDVTASGGSVARRKLSDTFDMLAGGGCVEHVTLQIFLSSTKDFHPLHLSIDALLHQICHLHFHRKGKRPIDCSYLSHLGGIP